MKWQGRRGHTATAAAACGVALALGSCGRTEPALTPVTATDLAKVVRMFDGDVVLVNIWATWCEPCRQEFPALLKFARDSTGTGFRLVLVSADFPEQRPNVLAFLAQQGVSFPTYLKAEGDMTFINMLDPRWSGALPATFVYGRDGALRDFWEGEANYETLARRIGPLLASAHDRGAEGGSR